MTIPSATRHLGEVRQFVAERAAAEGLEDEMVQELRMAVEEACANVIEHAYAGDASREIDVAVIADDERFTVRIRDEGEPFRPEAYDTPDLRELVRRRQSGGLGLHLMRRLMDQVEYRTRQGVNEVLLTKYRDGQPAG
ncbi:MAG: ATP-binding protein [Bacteroidetes bacterium SW_4_67_19]|jgi:serine/threonine-protein kinase RsbW|nr:MAG: ATP-binding protein [Bacteroidetes bacterium SW_4_67_19]